MSAVDRLNIIQHLRIEFKFSRPEVDLELLDTGSADDAGRDKWSLVAKCDRHLSRIETVFLGDRNIGVNHWPDVIVDPPE